MMNRLGVSQSSANEDAADSTCLTFVLHGEDHTLGNALRYVIMKNPEVQFCGYSIPHPTENKVNLRIQTKGSPATDVFNKGLTDLNNVCQHVLSTFERSVRRYKEHQLTAVDQEEDMDVSL
ncbi:DNA-directed RNA polymerases I and III subunit RPAC2-like [Amphiura filiformis]|uniref:DNA-directed RNA polymerases I and III subunit RPAC2-like n=1 Tax=Amphiura filiformis TaxID=82378 RepID=UPI003B216E4C